MSLPSAKQAQAFWLNAAGMNARQISDVMGCSPQAAQITLQSARTKAQKIGLKYTVTAPVEQPKVGSGMLLLKELAKEAGLLK